MNNLLSYKGYQGTIEYSEEDDCLHGRVLHIRSVLSYGGDTVAEIKTMFREAVDGYLSLCAKQGIEPEKPYKGSLNVRLGADLHREAAVMAAKRNTSLNELIVQAVKHEVRPQA
ncbi:type II toxin-antitoxin system HicB family antitoxin [Neisseria chenwenguii]|uniref:type II toxin-antitoxin system HicB family antitoxin n=1 Tax=Neisseria chenwenguii TaxID=1853278 RepID=UPI000F4DD554|nr:type II toxin-antitoxin system HicB family antitoxin [Neisseria chenwenguii]ROV56740.1 type II toxin-antitoxin system HicB family antitoxin [Neisseria chenwenguii]